MNNRRFKQIRKLIDLWEYKYAQISDNFFDSRKFLENRSMEPKLEFIDESDLRHELRLISQELGKFIGGNNKS